MLFWRRIYLAFEINRSLKRELWMILGPWAVLGLFGSALLVVMTRIPELLVIAALMLYVPLFIVFVIASLLVIVSVVVLLLDAVVFARWSGVQARLMPVFEGMLLSLFEDRPKSKHKRKPKIKRKNEWL